MNAATTHIIIAAITYVITAPAVSKRSVLFIIVYLSRNKITLRLCRGKAFFLALLSAFANKHKHCKDCGAAKRNNPHNLKYANMNTVTAVHITASIQKTILKTLYIII